MNPINHNYGAVVNIHFSDALARVLAMALKRLQTAPLTAARRAPTARAPPTAHRTSAIAHVSAAPPARRRAGRAAGGAGSR
eukprot:scaffold109826_cov55-Phaeocystis_antarctica.AAC.1